MPLDAPLRCRCGHVAGIARDVAADRGFHFVCYCADCQAFARWLERPDVLDAAGGTDIYQMPPARMELTAGVDALACLQLSPKVLRWYAACCRTPIANTAARPSFPLVAVIHAFVDHAAAGRSRVELLGPPRCRIFERSAIGPLPADAPPRASLALFGRRASMLLRWWLGGLAWPTPFFDPRTNAPRATPAAVPRARG